MADAAVRERWTRTASLMAVIVNMHKAKGPTVTAEAFMPPALRSRTARRRETVSVLKGLVPGGDRSDQKKEK